MRAAHTPLFVLFLALGGAAIWMSRIQYLPPVIFQDLPLPGNPTGRTLVVCSADRWSGHITCDTVAIDGKRTAEEMLNWAKEQKIEK